MRNFLKTKSSVNRVGSWDQWIGSRGENAGTVRRMHKKCRDWISGRIEKMLRSSLLINMLFIVIDGRYLVELQLRVQAEGSRRWVYLQPKQGPGSKPFTEPVYPGSRTEWGPGGWVQDSVREAYRALLMVRVMAGLGNGSNEAQSIQSHENAPGDNK